MSPKTDHDLHLHRVLKAPRSAVWACWTDPAHLPHWFAPKPVVTVVRALDLRPGGAFAVEMIVDGQSMGGEPGCFLEVVPEERLTWTSALGPDFRPVAAPFAPSAPFVFTATITLADHPDGTDYRVVARHKDAAAAQAHEDMGFSQGWGTVADQLGAYAATLGAGDRTLTISRRFRASPAQVFAAWTDPAVLPRWFGPEGYSCETEVIDIREGGEWRFTMRGDGMEWPNRHRWTALVPPEGEREGRIEFLMDGMDGQEPKAVTVRLAPDGTGTRLSQVMVFASPEDVAIAKSYSAEDKGQETLAKLAAHLGE